VCRKDAKEMSGDREGRTHASKRYLRTVSATPTTPYCVLNMCQVVKYCHVPFPVSPEQVMNNYAQTDPTDRDDSDDQRVHRSCATRC